MKFEEYYQYDALGLAHLVRQKQITPLELLDVATERLTEVNPKINAVVHNMYEVAKKMATQFLPNAPFGGVPFLLKDLGIMVAGAPLQSGSRGYKGFIAPHDSELTRRLRTAGLLFLGKTNTPEFGLTPFTEPQAHGATHNPWNTAYSAGGSSGGSAAAVAAGVVPLATASDGGGSIRIPAACCGLFGLKPTRGRVPLGDGSPELWAGAVCENSVSRSVRDSAALLDAIQGNYAGMPYPLAPPLRPYAIEAATMPRKLHIAYSLQHPFHIKPDKHNVAAIHHTVSLLRDAGHNVVEVPLPFSRETLLRHFLPIVFAETAALIAFMQQQLGKTITTSDVEINTWLMAKLGDAMSAKQYVYHRFAWGELSSRMSAFHKQYDLLLTPTLGRHPIKQGELQNSVAETLALQAVKSLRLTPIIRRTPIVEQIAAKVLRYIPYTPIANMTGQPAMNVPLYWATDTNVPIGAMFTAPIGDEATLYNLAAQLEQIQPWFSKMPKL